MEKIEGNKIKLIISFIVLFLVAINLPAGITSPNQHELMISPLITNENCEILYPNGGEEMWDLCTVEWSIKTQYPVLTLLSRVSIGTLESEYILTETGGTYEYTFNTRNLADGVYKARLKVYRDIDDDGEPDCLYCEDESDGNFSIINGPYPPEKPIGPAAGRINVSYTYETSTEHHIEHIPIKFMFSWGDGTNTSWIGPFAAGDPVSCNHTWSEFGEYEVKNMKLK